MSTRHFPFVIPLALGLVVGVSVCSSSSSSKATSSIPTTQATSPGTTPSTSHSTPKIGHVFVINLENENYVTTWGPSSPAKYLNAVLRPQGQLLTHYFAIGHASLDNYIAQISGQSPNADTQGDCVTYRDFASTGTGAYGQILGKGCVYPKTALTVADQLDAAGKTWKSYQEDIGNSSTEPKTCRHPELNAVDKTFAPPKGDLYVTRHNPFVYFHSIIDSPICAKDVVGLRCALDGSAVGGDDTEPVVHHAELVPRRTRPAVRRRPARRLVHRRPLVKQWVPKILASPAFKTDGHPRDHARRSRDRKRTGRGKCVLSHPTVTEQRRCRASPGPAAAMSAR